MYKKILMYKKGEMRLGGSPGSAELLSPLNRRKKGDGFALLHRLGTSVAMKGHDESKEE